MHEAAITLGDVIQEYRRDMDPGDNELKSDRIMLDGDDNLVGWFDHETGKFHTPDGKVDGCRNCGDINLVTGVDGDGVPVETICETCGEEWERRHAASPPAAKDEWAKFEAALAAVEATRPNGCWNCKWDDWNDQECPLAFDSESNHVSNACGKRWEAKDMAPA